MKCLLVQIPKCKSNSNGLGFKTSLTDVQKKEVLPTLVRSSFLSSIWTNVNFDGKTRPPPDRCTTRPQTCSLGQLAAARVSAGKAAAAEMYFSKELFESARAVTGRRCPRSGEGEDFLTGQPEFFYENCCNSGTESRKIDPKVGNERSLRGLQIGH